MKRQRLVATASVAAAILAVLGGAHVLLVASGGACPVRAPTAEALERQRRQALPELRGEGTSPSSDAFGFELGVTVRASFVAATVARGDRCEDELEGALVRCEGTGGEVVARFDPHGVLVGADRMRYVADVDDASSLFGELASAGARRFGTPSRSWGTSSPAYLAGPLHQVGVSYRFIDVAIDLSATHLGPGRIAVREQLRSIPRPSVRGG